ncbi:hypothetical protein Tco_1218097 [Tanacetum coccineum]
MIYESITPRNIQHSAATILGVLHYFKTAALIEGQSSVKQKEDESSSAKTCIGDSIEEVLGVLSSVKTQQSIEKINGIAQRYEAEDVISLITEHDRIFDDLESFRC